MKNNIKIIKEEMLTSNFDFDEIFPLEEDFNRITTAYIDNIQNGDSCKFINSPRAICNWFCRNSDELRYKVIKGLIVSILFNWEELKKEFVKKCKLVGFSEDEIKQLIKVAIANIQNFSDLNDRYYAQVLEVKNNIAKTNQEETLTEENKTFHINEKIEKHEILNPKLWNEDNTLKEEVEEKILEIVDTFIKSLAEDEIKINVDDIVLIGSNCSYNYNEGSDIDLHIIADTGTLDCPEKHLDKLYSAYRSLFNKKFDIDFYGIPVELYVETQDTNTVSNGIYSVKNKQWIKEPVQADIPEVDDEAIQKLVGEWTIKYNKVVEDRNIDEIDKFIEDVYNLRKEAMAKGEEYNENNLCFKELRNAGYLDYLKELKAEIKSEQLSLESLKETLLEGINNKTPKQVMLSAAKILVPELIKEDTDYDIHHLDYDNTNNNLENISLMKSHYHKSFHKKAQKMSKEEKDRLFNAVDDYQNNCIKIGQLILDNLGDEGEESELKEIKESLLDINEGLEDTEKINSAKSIISDQIKGEWDAIKNYEKAADDLSSISGDFNSIIDILNDISEEEKVHVGELEQAKAEIDKNILTNIDSGREEAEEKMSETANDLEFDKHLVERLDETQRLQYRQELSRISYNQAIIQDNGLFTIYNVKENDVDIIIRKIKNLDYVEWVNKTAGKFDFSQVSICKPQARYWNITGKIIN